MTSSQSPSDCRLLIDPPAPGAWNMAVDEVLLEQAAERNELAWRFYQWESPTISLGYFQQYDDRDTHPASAECDVVRRLTGGGAIVHDRELTYSLLVPATHRLAAQREELYRTVHNTLIEALAEYEIVARLCEGPPRVAPDDEPFLCFQRRATGDVLVGDHKIAGSAQRRRRGAVLQHGSVLLGRSDAARRLAGLNEITGKPFDANSLANPWADKIAEALQLRWQPQSLSTFERQRVDNLLQRRYAAEPWTKRRDREYPPPGS